MKNMNKVVIFEYLSRHKLAVILSIAIVARLAFLFIFGQSIFFYEQTGLIHGSTAYDDYALNLLETGVYGREAGIPDANIAPLYSYAVAIIYKLFGRGGLQIGLFHILLDSITIALVYDISRRLFRAVFEVPRPEGEGFREREKQSEWIGFGAGLFTALYPYLIFQNLTLIDTPFFMTLMYIFIWLMILLRERESYDKQTLFLAIIAGLILGMATLVRALLPLFAILTALWFLFRLPLFQTILRLLPVAIISILVLLPWMFRSYDIYDNFVALALNTGDNIWQGNNPMTVPLFNAGYDAQWSDPPPNSVRGNPYLNNQILTQAGLDYLQNNLEAIPELLWVKFLTYWSIEITPIRNRLSRQSFALDENGNLLILDDPEADIQDVDTMAQYDSGLLDTVARPIHILYFGGLLLLAIAGFVLSIRQWRELSLLIFLQISMMLMYMLFHPSTRYRVPTDPLLFAFSAYALLILIQASMKRLSKHHN
jgi:4-amino-4-deoxy-L-arabinose transferase-like glycosyltransferase